MPILLFYIKQVRIPFIISTVLAVAFLSAYPNSFIGKRIQSFSDNASFSNRYRIEHSKANLKLSFENPLLGVGYAANRKKNIIRPYLKKITVNEKLLYNHPHNEYLDVLVGMGYPMLFLFLAIIALPFLYNLRLLKEALDVSSKSTLAVLLSFQLFIFITAGFDKITSIEWSTILIVWMILFTIKQKKSSSKAAFEYQI